MKPLFHARSSARKFGGKPEDYFELHDFLDSSKQAIADNRHRALTHNSWFISVVIPRVFGDSIINTLHKIIHEPAPSITDLNPTASPDLQRVIRKCLSKEPEKRYQTIRDTANDLEEVIEEMKGVSDLERSVARPANATTSRPQILGGKSTDDDARGAESTVPISQQAASGAEYIVSGIKQHKLAAVIVLLVLVFGAVGLGLYLHARNNEVAIESIAVLPFDNQNHDPETEYVSDGLTDSIINSLTQLPNLKVIARSSVFRYKGKQTDPIAVANELGVRAVLMGRIMQRGDSLTISVELIDARDNKPRRHP